MDDASHPSATSPPAPSSSAAASATEPAASYLLVAANNLALIQPLPAEPSISQSQEADDALVDDRKYDVALPVTQAHVHHPVHLFAHGRVERRGTRQEAAAFTKLLYTTRLSRYASPDALANATETLATHYNLADNPDMLLSRAETLYTQCRFAEALELTTAILNPASDSMSASAADTTSSSLNIMTQGAQAHTLGHSPAVYPLHLACLYETGATNSLFLLAHTLIDNAPDESYAYLAIGIYYMAVSKIAEARRYFSKASLLDPHSAPAWIGFAHTFAAEGEHDQAIAAYSTAARLFQGSHLPQLFLGMQHLALNNLSLAHEYLRSAYAKSCAAAGGAGDTVRPELGTADDEDGGGGSGGSGGGGVGDAATARPPLRGGDPLVLNELGIFLC
ncbi:anaphase promoting complex subunit cdc16 [Ascosphaera acerosa]|nr:anaphase promoting complex subunit cdc16 [Ascosphaera acerosa]